MNNNSSKQVLLSVIGVAILVVAVVGVSFAFFSYVYNGEKPNTVKTGTIVFTASDSVMELTNVFPTDAANAQTATVSIYGNTTYANGIDFTVKVTDVTNASTTIIPKVTVTPKTDVDGVTFADGYDEAKTYGKTTTALANGVISQGTVAANTTVGSATAQTPILTISAYYDKADYHISDNTNKELSDAGLLDANYEANGGTIVSTDDWNALSKNEAGEAVTAYSFKIQVTAVEGATAPGTGA